MNATLPVNTAESSMAMVAKITVFHHGIGCDVLSIGAMMA
jgi:hypothetical protein